MGDINLGLTTPLLIEDKPTANKINRVIEENQVDNEGKGDLEKILEAIINPETKENGGIDALKLNDRYITLEKPLSQHTVGEVIDLLDKGYDNFWFIWYIT